MEKFKIEIKRSASKEIEKLPAKDRLSVLHKIHDLAINPRPIGCKKLSSEQKYRVRFGDYRILYSIEDNILVIFIIKAGHRKDVYRG